MSSFYSEFDVDRVSGLRINLSLKSRFYNVLRFLYIKIKFIEKYRTEKAYSSECFIRVNHKLNHLFVNLKIYCKHTKKLYFNIKNTHKNLIFNKHRSTINNFNQTTTRFKFFRNQNKANYLKFFSKFLIFKSPKIFHGWTIREFMIKDNFILMIEWGGPKTVKESSRKMACNLKKSRL